MRAQITAYKDCSMKTMKFCLPLFLLSEPRYAKFCKEIRLVRGGVQLGPLGLAATDWPIVACPGRLWWWGIWRNEDWQGKQKYSDKTHPSATLSTTNPTWPDPGSNPGHHGGMPVINCLSYGAVLGIMLGNDGIKWMNVFLRYYLLNLTEKSTDSRDLCFWIFPVSVKLYITELRPQKSHRSNPPSFYATPSSIFPFITFQ
jgi:hypothetical protein